MAQTEEFMFQNVAYRPTVYRTGVVTVRGVVPGDVGGAMAPTDFGRSVNQGGRLCPPNNTGTPRFSNLHTVL